MRLHCQSFPLLSNFLDQVIYVFIFFIFIFIWVFIHIFIFNVFSYSTHGQSWGKIYFYNCFKKLYKIGSCWVLLRFSKQVLFLNCIQCLYKKKSIVGHIIKIIFSLYPLQPPPHFSFVCNKEQKCLVVPQIKGNLFHATKHSNNNYGPTTLGPPFQNCSVEGWGEW